ncbi:MAG: ABC transporter ATP-binding protein [Planctomycetota bacterium]|jgi:ABC-type multidrug transport system ATPase subunit
MELAIDNVSKTYANGVRALRNVSLTIPKGMFGLLGPNGSGKSTLMRTIATLQEPDEGSIRFGLIDVLNDKEAVRRGLGYLPQEFGLYPNVSSLTLLTHLATLKGITDSGGRRSVVEALLKRTNLWDVRKKKLGGFSGGMKQRFGVAQALLGNPQLIIVDEPTAGLDPEERNRFLNLLSEIGENVVVILSTHIVDDVSEVCTSMAIIKEGRVLRTGQPQAAIDEMQGKTWKKMITKAELPRYQEEFMVISVRLTGGRTVIHVCSDGQPDPTFTEVAPDLQDVYFTTLGRANGMRARGDSRTSESNGR